MRRHSRLPQRTRREVRKYKRLQTRRVLLWEPFSQHLSSPLCTLRRQRRLCWRVRRVSVSCVPTQSVPEWRPLHVDTTGAKPHLRLFRWLRGPAVSIPSGKFKRGTETRIERYRCWRRWSRGDRRSHHTGFHHHWCSRRRHHPQKAAACCAELTGVP